MATAGGPEEAGTVRDGLRVEPERLERLQLSSPVPSEPPPVLGGRRREELQPSHPAVPAVRQLVWMSDLPLSFLWLLAEMLWSSCVCGSKPTLLDPEPPLFFFF